MTSKCLQAVTLCHDWHWSAMSSPTESPAAKDAKAGLPMRCPRGSFVYMKKIWRKILFRPATAAGDTALLGQRARLGVLEASRRQRGLST